MESVNVILHRLALFSRVDTTTMEIPTEIVKGINPTKLKETVQYALADNGTGDCISVEKRKAKKNGEFEQLTLHFVDKDNAKFKAQYLFSADLVLLAQAYGTDSTKWVGKLVNISVKIDGEYFRFVFKPVA